MINKIKFDNSGNLTFTDDNGVERIIDPKFSDAVNKAYSYDTLNALDNSVYAGVSSYSSSYSGSYDSRNELNEDDKEDLEILRLVKGYLASYLQKVLDDPDSVIEETINKKNEEKIKELIEENRHLKSHISILEARLDELTDILEKNGLTREPWNWGSTFPWNLPNTPLTAPYYQYQGTGSIISEDNTKLND